jgi:hypothetical protein
LHPAFPGSSPKDQSGPNHFGSFYVPNAREPRHHTSAEFISGNARWTGTVQLKKHGSNLFSYGANMDNRRGNSEVTITLESWNYIHHQQFSGALVISFNDFPTSPGI